MPTYNGSSITTGTLYEDGNIVVKKGFRTKETQDVSIPSDMQVIGAKQKTKISLYSADETDAHQINFDCAIAGTKQSTKIKIIDPGIFEIDPTSSYGVTSMEVVGIKTKTVIIVP